MSNVFCIAKQNLWLLAVVVCLLMIAAIVFLPLVYKESEAVKSLDDLPIPMFMMQLAGTAVAGWAGMRAFKEYNYQKEMNAPIRY